MLNVNMFQDYNEKFEQSDDWTLEPKNPILIRVKKEMFEDDFVEVGMIGILHKLELSLDYDSNAFILQVHIDFSNHTDHNKSLLKEVFYPNSYTAKLNINKELYTAEEAGYFSNQEQKNYSCWIGDLCHNIEDIINNLNEFLEPI